MNISEVCSVLNIKEIDKSKIRIPVDIFPDVFINNKISHDDLSLFTQVNLSLQDIPRQGFKIHVSCTINNYQNILFKVYKFCKKEKITFKYISNSKILKFYLSQNIERQSAGKFITIYPNNFQHFKIIIEKIYRLLNGFHGCYILSDNRYKDSECVYYRYGIMNTKDNMLIDPAGMLIEDIRTPYYNLPSFVEEPFPILDENKKKSYLLDNYKIESVIQFKNGGGTYIAYNKKSNKKVVIKEARRNIGDVIENQNQKFKKNEGNLLKRHSKIKCIPNLYEEFSDWENYYIVVEYINGKNLEEYRNIYDFNQIDDVESKFKEVILIIENIIQSIKELHQNYIFINDLSPSNIIIQEDYTVMLIDLEHAIELSDNSYDIIFFKTREYYNNETTYLKYFRQDFQQLGYILMSLVSKSNFLLRLDGSGELSWWQFKLVCVELNIPLYLVEVIEELIYSNNLDLHFIEERINNLKNTSLYDNQLNNNNFHYKKNNVIKDIKNFISDTKKTIEYYEKREYFPTTVPNEIINSFFYGSEGISKTFKVNIKENINPSIVFNRVEKIDLLDSEELDILLDDLIEYIEETTDYSIKSGLAGIGVIINSCDTNNKKINLVTELIRSKLKNYFFRNIDNLKINSSLGLTEGILGIIYYFSVSKDNKYMKEDIEICLKGIDLYSQEYINKDLDFNMQIKKGGKKFSPYIENGLAGFLLTLCNIIIKLNNQNSKLEKKYTNLLIQYSKGLFVTYTQNGTFLFGMSGIGYTLLAIYSLIPEKKYLKHAVKIFYGLEKYCFRYHDNINTYSVDFNSIGIELGYGITGLTYFSKKLLKILEKDVGEESGDHNEYI